MIRLIALFFFTQLAFANDGVVVKQVDEGHKLTFKGKEYDLVISGGTPSFKKIVEKPESGVDLIIYFSGTAGTFRPVDIERAIVIDRKSGINHGDYPYSYRPVDGTKYEQPKWEFKKGLIKITDESFEVNKTIKTSAD